MTIVIREQLIRDIERIGLSDAEIAECEIRRERARANVEAYRAAEATERATLDAELGPLPPAPIYRRAKEAGRYIPSAAEGREMALDMGFDPHVAGVAISVADPADEERARREWMAAAHRRSAEDDRRREIVRKRLEARGITWPALTGCHSLGFFAEELRRGADSTRVN